MKMSLRRVPRRAARRLRREIAQLRNRRRERRLIEWRRIAGGDRQLLTVGSKHGRITFDSADSVIGQWLYRERQFEYELMVRTGRLLRELGLLDPDRTTFIDAGANIGTTTTTFLRNGVFEHAVAVEPESSNFALLERNVRQNGLHDRVLCVPVALGDTPGDLVLELSPTNFGDHRIRMTTADGEYQEAHRSTRTIRVERLDDLLNREDRFGLRSVGLLWMDVQGFEGHVLRGSQGLLAQGVPVELEFWPYGMERAGTTPEAFLRLLAGPFARFIDLRDPDERVLPIAAVRDLYARYAGRDGATEILLFPGERRASWS
jgi:FkbM family methyltransferase